MIIRQEIIYKLNKALKLPYTGSEQDWDLEMADDERIDEFLNFYMNCNQSDEEKVATMSLILASYEDFLIKKNLDKDRRWEIIMKLLTTDKSIYLELFDYWILKDEILDEDSFKIAPLLRNIK